METFIKISNILHIIGSLPLLAIIIKLGGNLNG
jgi:hypothetical protein